MRHGFPSEKRAKTGFSMAELLIVVAILAVLAAVAIPNIVRYQQELKLAELDAAARSVFLSAQNRMTAMRASGELSALNAAGQPLSGGMISAIGAIAEEEGTDTNAESLCWLSKDGAAALFPAGSLESQTAAGDYVVEYDPASGSVYAVFFCAEEGALNYSDADEAYTKRDETSRRKHTPMVGYYGGSAASELTTVQLDPPTITIENAEKLTVTVTASLPEGLNNVNGLVPTLTINGKTITGTGGAGEYTYVLDALNEPFSSLGTGVTPGEDVTLEVELNYVGAAEGDTAVALPSHASAAVNSLFAGRNGSTVQVAYGRHLQNLDAVGLDGSITAAVQTRAIDWTAEQGEGDYPDKFTALNNQALKRYDGRSLAIANLTVEGNGLFAAMEDGTLSNIRLADTAVSGSGAVGALAGTAKNVTVAGCQVYLDERAQNKTALISGTTAGGLIGSAEGGSITDSFAATLVSGSTVGGLAGEASNVAIETSYADCELTGGSVVGGLVGSMSGGRVASCYAAGRVLAAGGTPGGLLGAVSSVAITGSYSALTYADAITSYYGVAQGMRKGDTGWYLSDASQGTAAENSGTAQTYEELAQQTLTGFEPAGVAVSHPYQRAWTEGLTLSGAYPFPKLKGLDHYGDWPKRPETGGWLVYYERYADDSYGYYGSFTGTDDTRYSVDTLKNDLVAEDGYAFLTVKKLDKLEYAVGTDPKATVASPVPLETELTLSGLTGLYAYGLPVEAVQVAGTEGYYQKLTVNGQTGWFCPHFAKEAYNTEEAPVKGGTNNTVWVRSARQLNALSEYGGAYASQGYAFVQELDLDYTQYDGYDDAYEFGDDFAQESIGYNDGTKDVPFTGSYDGRNHIITGFSVYASHGATGLFGIVKAELKNIRWIADNTAYVRSVMSFESNVPVGALVGDAQRGTVVENCTAAGFEVSGGTNAVVGGLVGGNNGGTIRNCYADCHVICTNNGTNTAGGLVGENSGTISGSYALGLISGQGIRAGFAGGNSGTISDSYSATVFEDDPTGCSGFTRNSVTGAQVTGCLWLKDDLLWNGEPYSTAKCRDTLTGAAGVTYDALKAGTGLGTGWVKGETGRGVSYPYDEKLEGQAYPFPMLAETDHYGDWPTAQPGGHYGLFYWERYSDAAYGVYLVALDSKTGLVNEEAFVDKLDRANKQTIQAWGYGLIYPETANEATWTVSVNGDSKDLSAYTEFSGTISGVDLSGYKLRTLNISGPGIVTLSVPNQYSGWFQVDGYFAAAVEYLARTDANGKVDWCVDEAQVGKQAEQVLPGTGGLSSLTTLGTEAHPYEVRTGKQLQNINEKESKTVPGPSSSDYFYTDAHYIQTHDLTWSNGSFDPLGTAEHRFAGSYTGLAQVGTAPVQSTIKTLNATLFDKVGETGTVSHVTLNGSSVTGNGSSLGLLVNVNDGTVSDCSVSGTISGKEVAGVVWENNGTVKDCAAAVTVTGSSTASGFVGTNKRTLTGSTLTSCTISGGSGGTASGFVDENKSGGTISGSTLTSCIVTGAKTVSGFADQNNGGVMSDNELAACQVTSITSGSGTAAGFVSQNKKGTLSNNTLTGCVVTGAKTASGFAAENGAAVANCTVSGSTVTVSGSSGTAAGFAVENKDDGTISGSAVTGTAVSGASAAGFAVENGDTIANCTVSDGTVTASGNSGTAAGFVTENKDDGTIADCTVSGGTVTASGNSGTAAGFAGTNEGALTGCQVRPADAVLSYSAMTVTASGNNGAASGFVDQNKGEVKTCLASGEVTADGNAAGFARTNTGTIESCYANCVTAGTNAAGFVYTSSGTVKHSYALLQVVATGNAYGFTAAKGSGISNCYAATEVSGENGSYTFGPQNGAYLNCWYLKNPNQGKTETGTQITYEALSTTGLSGWTASSGKTTYPYSARFAGQSYPFPAIDGLDHYGDWLTVSQKGVIGAFVKFWTPSGWEWFTYSVDGVTYDLASSQRFSYEKPDGASLPLLSARTVGIMVDETILQEINKGIWTINVAYEEKGALVWWWTQYNVSWPLALADFTPRNISGYYLYGTDMPNNWGSYQNLKITMTRTNEDESKTTYIFTCADPASGGWVVTTPEGGETP